MARLSSHAHGIPEPLQSLLDPAKGVGVEEVAAIVLDRVKIMRVFDFEGVREAVSEIKTELERDKDGEAQKKSVVNLVGGKGEGPVEPEKAKRTYVADSEDEEDYEEDEMLFGTGTNTANTIAAPNIDPQPTSNSPGQQQRGGVKFILIDTLAQVINPLLKKDYIQGLSSPPFNVSNILYANSLPPNSKRTIINLARIPQNTD